MSAYVQPRSTDFCKDLHMSKADIELHPMSAPRANWFAYVRPEVDREFKRFQKLGREGDRQEVIQWAVFAWMQLSIQDRAALRLRFAEWVEAGMLPLDF